MRPVPAEMQSIGVFPRRGFVWSDSVFNGIRISVWTRQSLSQRQKDSESLRVRAYTLSHRVHTGLLRAIDAVHTGFWLGVIDGKHLQQSTAAYYARQSKYLDHTYNLGGLSDWETAIVEGFFSGVKRLLVPGAGGGRELVALARLGYEVVGFDCDRGLIDSARSLAASHGLDVDCRYAPAGALPHLDSAFDGIIFGWGAFIHIQGAENRVALLSGIRRVVRPSAPLLVSFFERSPSSRRFRVLTRIAKVIRRLRGSKERVEWGDRLDGSFDHYFTREEIDAELRRSGFRLRLYKSEPYPHALAFAE